jgi:hypothetical protein
VGMKDSVMEISVFLEKVIVTEIMKIAIRVVISNAS